uniref:Uncharacterized protein n=1 Tax=Arundo donax TaxID=35708 RepID=A0A0A9GD20_ARUDO
MCGLDWRYSVLMYSNVSDSGIVRSDSYLAIAAMPVDRAFCRGCNSCVFVRLLSVISLPDRWELCLSVNLR